MVKKSDKTLGIHETKNKKRNNRESDRCNYDFIRSGNTVGCYQEGNDVKNIIEKLKLKKIPCKDFGSGDFVFSRLKVRNLEEVRNTILNALIVAMEALEYVSDYDIPLTTHETVKSAIEITTGKSWEEIKELLDD